MRGMIGTKYKKIFSKRQQNESKSPNNYKGEILWDGIRLRRAAGKPAWRL